MRRLPVCLKMRDAFFQRSEGVPSSCGHRQIKIGVAEDWIGSVRSKCRVASASPNSGGLFLQSPDFFDQSIAVWAARHGSQVSL